MPWTFCKLEWEGGLSWHTRSFRDARSWVIRKLGCMYSEWLLRTAPDRPVYRAVLPPPAPIRCPGRARGRHFPAPPCTRARARPVAPLGPRRRRVQTLIHVRLRKTTCRYLTRAHIWTCSLACKVGFGRYSGWHPDPHDTNYDARCAPDQRGLAALASPSLACRERRPRGVDPVIAMITCMAGAVARLATRPACSVPGRAIRWRPTIAVNTMIS